MVALTAGAVPCPVARIVRGACSGCRYCENARIAASCGCGHPDPDHDNCPLD